MKNVFFSLLCLIAFSLLACNSGDNHDQHAGGKPKTLADSLVKEIDDIHMVGMSKMGALTTLQQRARKLADSVNKLPAKAKQAVAGYKSQLDSLVKDLDYAEFAMDKWMMEFYQAKDTLVNNAGERIKYLGAEKIKAEKLKETILGGIRKADSLLHKQF